MGFRHGWHGRGPHQSVRPLVGCDVERHRRAPACPILTRTPSSMNSAIPWGSPIPTRTGEPLVRHQRHDHVVQRRARWLGYLVFRRRHSSASGPLGQRRGQCWRSENNYSATELIEGTEDRDRLIGSNADDDIYGFNGDDKLIGKSGDDWIYPGEFGRRGDKIKTGSGEDIVFADQNGWFKFLTSRPMRLISAISPGKLLQLGGQLDNPGGQGWRRVWAPQRQH